MSCEDKILKVYRGKTQGFWLFPSTEVKNANNKDALRPISMSAYTITGKIYDKDPETATDTVTELVTMTATKYAAPLTDDALEAAEEEFDGEVLDDGYEVADFDAIWMEIAAADTKHSVSAINTAIYTTGDKCVFGVEAVNGATILDLGSGGVEWEPDRVRT